MLFLTIFLFPIIFGIGIGIGYSLKIFWLKKKKIALEEEISQKIREAESEIWKRKKKIIEREKELNFKLEQLKEREEKVKKKEEELREKEKEIKEKIEKISGLKREEARKEILAEVEKEMKNEILEKIEKLEKEEKEKIEQRAKEILAFAIQRLSVPITRELTQTTFFLPSAEIKGKIIGKEGRNIRTFEKLTGVEILFDEETPDVISISSFDPVRREIAKLALQKLIEDGRIQPVKIEEKVKEAEEEIEQEIKRAGELACGELGIFGLDKKLIQLLGRLKFRSSFGQNVLLHSIEVAYLAEAIAQELGADSKVCKIAGLFHDIGKALDQHVSGSHTQIGMKILEKFGIEKKIIDAMKSHHEEYPPESIEAIIVKVADQISGARPGARKETVEQYIKRLEELEKIALSFPEVKKAWALEAGREIRVFVKPEEIDDYGARKLAKEIAKKIEEEIKYPGMIKITLIREFRVTEYAK